MIIISNRVDKPKKSAQELVEKLRDEKGISFVLFDEATAIDYLSHKNNYLRTASYRKNYDKHLTGENKGKYINLDFAYLAEVSTIDMHFRAILLPMCIDIEHALKVKITEEIESNNAEDGYTIVDEFLAQYPSILKSIEQKADSVFTGDLINKYFQLCSVFEVSSNANANISTRILSNDCPTWVLVEIIGFRNLIQFISFYNKKYPGKFPIDDNIMNPVRSLRNACAHNNCILNCMRPKSTKPSEVISSYVSSVPAIGKEERQKKLSCRPLFEFVCLLYAYNNIVSENVRVSRFKQLQSFVNTRLFKRQEYFEDNQIISTSFAFIKKVVDNLT